MAQKDKAPRDKENVLSTCMRTPFTAERPGELGTKPVEFLPDFDSYPDVSDEECPATDPLALLPGTKGRSSG